jgi:hypothetical protein
MSDEQGVESSGTTRRRFVQAAAAAGVIGAVWTEPIIRGSVAGAQTGVSVDGQCTGAAIEWSNGNNMWLNVNASTFNDTGTDTTAVGTYTWNTNNMICDTPPALTAPVTVTATGSPEGVNTATVQITSGVSCSFSMLVASSGTVMVVTTSSFTYTGGNLTGTNPSVTFDIVC